MLGHGEEKEQRRSTRFIVEENAYALLKQPHYSEMAKIVDISKSGIGFLCVNEGDWSDAPFTIDILCDGNKQNQNHQLESFQDIPLHPISYCSEEIPTKEDNRFFKRCGVRFGDLSPEQQLLIDRFIQNHTYGST